MNALHVQVLRELLASMQQAPGYRDEVVALVEFCKSLVEVVGAELVERKPTGTKAETRVEAGEGSRRVNRQEAARLLGVSVSTLEKLMYTGGVPYSKLGISRRSRVVFDRRDLEEFLARHRRCREPGQKQAAGGETVD